MARTTIKFEYNGENYTLGLTIAALKKLEKAGFSFGNIEDHILTATEDIFYATFDAFHRNTPRKLREEIYHEFCAEEDSEDGKAGNTLSETLFAMINEVIEEMSPKGNVKWKTVKG